VGRRGVQDNEFSETVKKKVRENCKRKKQETGGKLTTTKKSLKEGITGSHQKSN